ncbi:MAG: type II toxin-antitoxin system HicB family antitoxin [Cyanobacteria bacterium J06628_3]
MTTISTKPKTSPKLNYDVLIENQADGSVSVSALNLPNCQATGATREEALQNLTQLLTQRLANAEIVSLEIEPPKKEHPWMKFAGMFKDDPQFDEMMEYIEQERREDYAQMEEYYRQLDAEDESK